MAVDKLVDSTQLDADLTSVANAIRAKSGESGQLAFPSGFVSEIGNIPSGSFVQSPYKVSSGSIIPASNTQALHVPLNGITNVAVATILVDDYENYATKYIGNAPIFLRMNQGRNTPITGSNNVSSSVSLTADGTLGASSNQNGAGVSGTDYVFGCYLSSTYFRTGVTYNYVVVGV